MKYLIFLSIFLISNAASADWLEEGKVMKVISGDTFTYFGYRSRKTKKYIVSCVSAANPKTRKGRMQKKFLKSIIVNKKIFAMISGIGKNSVLLDLRVVEKVGNDNHYHPFHYIAVKQYGYKKKSHYPECWEW